MRYNSMPRGEFFFVVDSVIAKELISTDTNRRMMVINAPELEMPLYVFMASDIKEYVSYKKVHKALRKELRKSSK